MPHTSVALHHVHDLALSSRTGHANPFRVKLHATFAHQGGQAVRNLPGFYDGDGTWKIRFSPLRQGRWKGVTHSDDPNLDAIELPVITCVPNRNRSIHGLVGIDPRDRHRFAWSDGTPCVPLGFELDWLAAFHQRLGQPKGRPVNRRLDRFAPAMDLLVRRGFNYLAACVYAHRQFTPPSHPYALTPPDLYCFGGTNEQPDHSVLNVAFFRDFDQAVAALHRRGIVLNLMLQVLNKDANWPAPRSAEDDAYWQYVVARYQAYGNIIWDVAKESFRYIRDLPDHGKGYIHSRLELIRRTDAYRHLVTAHDNQVDSNGCNTDIDGICDFVSDQVHCWRGRTTDAVDIAWELNREAMRRFRGLSKPYVNIEYGYERGAEPIPTIDMGAGTRSGEDLLIWAYALYAGGGHANYYYNNTSWNLVKFRPEPPSWRRYGYLRGFLDRMDLRGMAPDNDFSRNGMCLARCGRRYFVFLPEGGDDVLDLAAVDARPLECRWMDILTGKIVCARLRGGSFLTPLKNPLPDTTQPCAVYLEAT